MTKIETSSVRIGGNGDRPFNGFLAVPEGTGLAPAVVVLQEILGVTAFVEDVCTWLAGEGFIALAPDLFWRDQPGLVLDGKDDAQTARGRAAMQGIGITQLTVDSAAAAAAVRAIAWCNGKVGYVGYCMGGMLAYRMATLADCDAAVSYYGTRIHTMLDLVPDLRAPLMLHMAENDALCPPEAQAQIHEVLEGQSDVVIHDYPEAEHAFARTGSRNFHPVHTALANARTLAFFRTHLK